MQDKLEEQEPFFYEKLSCPVKRGRYHNPYIDNIRKSPWDFLMWRFGRYAQDSLQRAEPPQHFSYPNPQTFLHPSQPTVSWINHSTFHVTYKNLHFLTDPIWSHRCSPFNFLGPKRVMKPPVSLDDFSKMDFVLISHDHYDHLDKKTVLTLAKKHPHVFFIVPKGVKKWFNKHGITRVIELAWWETHTMTPDGQPEVTMKITSVPAQHFSGRGLFNKNSTLWSGFVIQFFEHNRLIKQWYFVGDTGYNPYDFVNIGNAFGYFDLSLIPIGTYVPNSFMVPVHISPNEAAKIHKEVNSQLSIGMHFKTFPLSEEHLEQPPYDLFQAMKSLNLDVNKFRVLNPGQRINW